VGCLRRRSLSGADQAKGVPACFVSVRAAAKQRRLRAKGGVSAFAPTPIFVNTKLDQVHLDTKFEIILENKHTQNISIEKFLNWWWCGPFALG
jgi:hypothetical protein